MNPDLSIGQCAIFLIGNWFSSILPYAVTAFRVIAGMGKGDYERD